MDNRLKCKIKKHPEDNKGENPGNLLMMMTFQIQHEGMIHKINN